MSPKFDPIVSIVIPTYNPDPANLEQALLSVANQTLHNELFEIILVDDASQTDVARSIFESIKEQHEPKGLRLNYIKHEQNLWLSGARTTGANASEAEFIVFLDDDDLLEQDYIKKCLILLEASSSHDWVYTNHRKFEQRNEFRQAPRFNPLLLTVRNRVSYSSMFRRAVWLEIGQRKELIGDNLYQFEDWDMYVRMITKGHIGTPLRDTNFHYRKSSSGLANRSLRNYLVSVYLLLRKHSFKFPLLLIPYLKHRRTLRKGYAQSSLLHPMRHINHLVRWFASRFLGISEVPGTITFTMMIEALCSPKRFISRVRRDHNFLSVAAMRSGFHGMTDFSFTSKRPFPTLPEENALLAGNIWWKMGGAETIYWYWLKAARVAGAKLVLNLVSQDDGIDSVKKNEFSQVSDQQFSMLRFGDSPQQRLEATWNLILLERPRLIFISSNSYLYQLSPYIKKQFPDIKIIDILHNEYDGLIDWFSTSSDYDQFIDKRIVTSDYWKNILVNKYKVDAAKVCVHRNPVDTDLFDPDKYNKKALKDSFRLHPSKKTVSFIGRLHPQKGLDRFLLLVKEMQTNTDIQFLIAGDGELKDEVIKAEKNGSNLKYIGYMPTSEKVLAVSDILMCPSLYEGAPLIGLEAAAMNTTVVAPNLIGFREQIEEGNFGHLYESSTEPYDDVKMLEELLSKDFEKLMKLGKNGRKFILEKHAYSVVEPQYAKELSEFFND
jgi:glycosyltransferase involved in cell wall biosynthesis